MKEAKDKVEAAPCVLLETTSMEDAERYKTALEICGATVTISSSITDVSSQETKLKKIGIGFIILNLVVVFGGAAVIAGIPHILIEMDFFSVFFLMAIIFATLQRLILAIISIRTVWLLKPLRRMQQNIVLISLIHFIPETLRL